MKRSFRASVISAALTAMLAATNTALKVAIRLTIIAAALAGSLAAAQAASMDSAPVAPSASGTSHPILLVTRGAGDAAGHVLHGHAIDNSPGDHRGVM